MKSRRAFIISLMNAPPKYPGEKVITVICPYCGAAHRHRGEQSSERKARCNEALSYLVGKWSQL